MRYDKDGFPIPSDFDFRSDAASDEGFSGPTAPARPARGGSRKKVLLFALVAAGLLPAIAGPELMPAISHVVVEWSLERAVEREARNDVAGAVSDVSRAVRWHGDDVELLCMLAMLRLENREAVGALADANRAAAIAPTAIQPLRVRALVQVVNGDADAALADARMVVELASPDDPDALNHRAYVRALVGRELPAALSDIERAIESNNDVSAELLDTKGYILHLLGRQQEAIDQLNLAIESMQQSRRQVALLAGRISPVELARRQRATDHALAVMFHHRGLACRAIGLEQQARQDLQLADQKGFDPSRGIF